METQEAEYQRLLALLPTIQAQGACERTIRIIRMRIEQLRHSLGVKPNE